MGRGDSPGLETLLWLETQQPLWHNPVFWFESPLSDLQARLKEGLPCIQGRSAKDGQLLP